MLKEGSVLGVSSASSENEVIFGPSSQNSGCRANRASHVRFPQKSHLSVGRPTAMCIATDSFKGLKTLLIWVLLIALGLVCYYSLVVSNNANSMRGRNFRLLAGVGAQ